MEKFIRTNQMIVVVCRCGSCIAAHSIYGGIEIDADFTLTMAEAINKGGKCEIVNSHENQLQFTECVCEGQITGKSED